MKKIIIFAIVLLVSSLTQAQVIVAPTILFMSDQSRFGTFVVMNRSNTPQEISVSFRFGFPESDSSGTIRMQYNDSSMAQEHSCQSWVKGFPQKFIVNPGQQQVVRLLVAPPADIPDGEYWTRLVTSSTPQAKTIDTVRTGITANITFVLEQVTTIIYKKGNVSTSVDVPTVEVKQDSASVDLLAHVTRGGNSPFFGKVSAVVQDKAGNKLYSEEEVIAVYRNEMTLKFAVPLSKLREGSYTADIKLTSERSDISQDDLLKTAPLEKTIDFSVQ
jgi:P pilus assembly chaperone PapD